MFSGQASAAMSERKRRSRSGAKRLFDILSALLVLPFVALAVRFTLAGPVFFTQRGIGRYRRRFTIFKFRTMEHAAAGAHQPVIARGNQRFTPNVLRGDMSSVGPRPNLPQHQFARLLWRPGTTGVATSAFARDVDFLVTVPADYRAILPAKHKLDSDYVSPAMFGLDLKLFTDTVLRRWDTSQIRDLRENFSSTLEQLHQASKSARTPFSWAPAQRLGQLAEALTRS